MNARQFVTSWRGRLLLFSLLLLPLLVSLGIWQWQRAEQKQQIVSDLNERLAREVEPWQTAVRERYQPVWVEARLAASPVMLLDNRTLNGRSGYDVIQQAVDDRGEKLLVHRGWVPAADRRQQPPEVPGPNQPLLLRGYLEPAVTDNYVLGGAEQSLDTLGEGSPQMVRVQQVTAANLRQVFGEAPQWLIKLHQPQAAAFAVSVPQPAVSVAKHQGYAFQWFAMAIALCMITLYSLLKKQGIDD